MGAGDDQRQGERAGNADLLEVALRSRPCTASTRLDLGQACSRASSPSCAGTPLPPWKAVTGDALFTRTAPSPRWTTRPRSSLRVRARRRRAGIVLGKKSGLDSIRIAVERLGLDVPADRHAELLAEVKRLGTSEQRLVTDDELVALVTRMQGGTDDP